jgi:hypothetical protein
VNKLTLHDDLSGKTIQLAWSDFCALLLSAENPSDIFSNKDKQQLQQIASTFREFID